MGIAGYSTAVRREVAQCQLVFPCETEVKADTHIVFAENDIVFDADVVDCLLALDRRYAAARVLACSYSTRED